MSEIDIQYGETGFFTEDSKLVAGGEKPKHPSKTEKDDATLLSEGSSTDEDENEDDLVLEYTDGCDVTGTLQESVDYEDGESSSASDDEISGLTNDNQVYQPPTPVVEKLLSFEGDEQPDQPVQVEQDTETTKKRESISKDTLIKDEDISKITEVLSNAKIESEKLTDNGEKAFVKPGKAIAVDAVDVEDDSYNDGDESKSKEEDTSSCISDSNALTNNTSELSYNDELEWEEEYLDRPTFKDNPLEVDRSVCATTGAEQHTVVPHVGSVSKPTDVKAVDNYEERAHRNGPTTDLINTSYVAQHEVKNVQQPRFRVDHNRMPIPEMRLIENSPSVASQRSKQKKNKKRIRHKIYLDDPDIHQRISDYAGILTKFASEVGARKSGAGKAQNKLHPVSRDDVFEVKSKKKGKKKRYTAPSMLKMMDNEPDENVERLRGSQSAGHLGPYDGHGKRGQNLIARIKQVSESESSSTADEDEITNKKVTMARLSNSRQSADKQTILCEECGEEHSIDEESHDDSEQEICPDCGIPHNPFQHPPSPSKKDQPEPKADDSLPSIEGPHTLEELNVGVRYKMKYLGTTQVLTQHPVTKETRMHQAQEAYCRIKVADGEVQPCTQTEMIISLQRLKVVNCEGKREDIMMDHALRTVCFICDIGNIMVLMSRRLTTDLPDLKIEEGSSLSLSNIMAEREKRTSKNICHIFECEEAQTISKAIGQAFNMAYRQFLKSNGISHDNVEEAEYCHVLESQKIVGQDLDLLTDQNKSRDVVIEKKRGESLGLMLLESGWGSMLPTVFIAHIANYSPAARLGGQISVGDHILACNGASFVGLPLAECNQLLRNTRTSSRAVLKLVACPPVVDVVVSRPDTKYQLGFSVQNGTICSLLRGGIAERGGVRVGHRIIEINGESVVAKTHQHIVDILAHTSGEISMKTLPVAMYRLMVGIDTPSHLSWMEGRGKDGQSIQFSGFMSKLEEEDDEEPDTTDRKEICNFKESKQ
eukprot:gene9774-10772_t